MRDDVIQRLLSFGYTVLVEDDWVLTFVIDKIENRIKINCNISEIPETLLQVAVDMVCGEFLLAKKSTGQLVLEGLDFGELVAKQISEGDTSVTFATSNAGTLEDQFAAALYKLINPDEMIFAAFRRVAW